MVASGGGRVPLTPLPGGQYLRRLTSAVDFPNRGAVRREGSIGEWLSLVEHLVRDQGVAGSNPVSPTWKGAESVTNSDGPRPSFCRLQKLAVALQSFRRLMTSDDSRKRQRGAGLGALSPAPGQGTAIR